MNKKLLAEFIGTFILSLTVLLSVSGVFIVPTPILAGLVLTLFVYTIGNVSGCHINPAVTLGLFSIRKISGATALRYIIAQLLGAVLAIIVVDLAGVTLPLTSPAPLHAYFFEMLGTALLGIGVGSVVLDPQKSIMSGVIIGGSLLLGISLSVLGGGGGIINPAVAVALRTMDGGYYLAEIIGGVLGFQFYAYLTSNSLRQKN